ncbi:MAG: T9SS type A sorting domain-containing protein [Flavobacterium sp.]
MTWEYTTPSSITTFGEDRNGELYVAAGNTIYKIIDTSLGIKGVKKKALSIFPNPAKNEIFIQNDSETFLSKAKIFDLTGKLLSVKFIENGNNPRITISGLARGLYMLTVEDLNGNQYSSKIIIE